MPLSASDSLGALMRQAKEKYSHKNLLKMKAEITITTGDYGFSRNWSLVLSTPKVTKTFFLGQDVKFCHRVLGMSPSDVVEAIGTNEIDSDHGRSELAALIVDRLGLNGRNFKSIEPWALCAQ